MDKLMFNGVNILNPLEGKLDEVIEYFVAFYGEKYRERITEKIKSTTFIFVPRDRGRFNAKVYEKDLNELIEQEINKMYEKLCFKLGVNLFTAENERYPITTIAKVRRKIANGEPLMFGEQNLYSAFKNSNGKVLSDKEILSLIDVCIMEYDKTISPKIKELHEQKERVLAFYENAIPSTDEIKKQAKIDIRQLMELYFFKLLESRNIDLTQPGEIPNIVDVNGKKIAVSREILKQLEVFCELFKQERFPEFATPSQREKYINLFKFFGFDYGENYKEYTQDRALKGLIFNGYLQDAIMDVEDMAEGEIKTANTFYLDAVDIIESLGIKYEVNKDDVLYALESYMYSDKVDGMAISYLDKNNQLKAVCFCEDYLNLATSTLVHELNHIVQESLIGESARAFYTKTGYDIIPFEKTEGSLFFEMKLTNAGNRQFEMLNEIINEYLSLKIFELMKADEFEIGVAANVDSAYYDGFYVFDRFIKENMEPIIESCFSTDKRALGNIIGDTEFKRLAEIAEDVLCSKYFDLASAISEIARVLKIDAEQYQAFDNIEDLAHGHEWSKNAKKYLTYVERANKLGRKLKQADMDNSNTEQKATN